MILYNTYRKPNNFGFDDINHQSNNINSIHSRNIKRATPCSKKHLKNKLSAENIAFLKSLGLKVKRS